MNAKNLLLSVLAVGLLSAVANAGIPRLNATCPGGIEVHADAGGPVYINGNQASLRRSNNNYYEASGSGVKISISINPDGSPTLTYTGRHRANGVCKVTDFDHANAGGASAPSNNGVAVRDMARYCAGEASAKFHQRPANISTQPAIKDHGMYSVFGQFPPSGADPTVFICTFSAEGKFVGVDKQ
jgi:hypothetical protein